MEHCKFSVGLANATEIPAIAAIFTESFQASVLHHCGRIPEPKAMEDVFTLVYEAENTAAFVARDEAGQVIGYCFAPAQLSAMWKKAVFGGRLLRWAWRWLTGRYGIGLQPVKVLFFNKLSFLRSALTPTKTADARILSIAVTTAWHDHGVAGALMDLADRYFRSRHVRRVRLEVRPDNEAAIRLYRHKGYVNGGTTQDSQGPWLILFKEME